MAKLNQLCINDHCGDVGCCSKEEMLAILGLEEYTAHLTTQEEGEGDYVILARKQEQPAVLYGWDLLFNGRFENESHYTIDDITIKADGEIVYHDTDIRGDFTDGEPTQLCAFETELNHDADIEVTITNLQCGDCSTAGDVSCTARLHVPSSGNQYIDNVQSTRICCGAVHSFEGWPY